MKAQLEKIRRIIPASVTIIAVTKKISVSSIEEAFKSGLRGFGENYVEEFADKWNTLPKHIRLQSTFHMIGHLQSRKIKQAVSLFNWVDSVDSLELLEKLDVAAGSIGKKLHVLLQVNISGEPQKFGFDLLNWERYPSKLHHFDLSIHRSADMKNILVDGLMTMAPYVRNSEDNRSIFRSTKKLLKTINTQSPGFRTQLSMGTSCDYVVAVEEGATQIRIGEALFGKRNK